MTVLDTPIRTSTTNTTRPPTTVAAESTSMSFSGLESLQKGLIHTDISPNLARWMVALFIFGIAIVPITQLVVEIVSPHRYVQELDLVRPPVRAAKDVAHGRLRPAAHELRVWLTKDNLSKFEDDLKEQSVFRHVVQPRAQLAITKYLGFGNDGAVVAREKFMRPNGWLFYQLGIDYLNGPGMLHPDYIKHRERKMFDDGEEDVCADPRKAIIQFHKDCQAAGAHLVFVLLPVKPALQPAELEGRDLSASRPVAQNRDYDRFIADLRAAGVDVFDQFVPKTVEPDADPLFLEQDTHWTPQWMESVAAQLADHIKKQVNLPAPAYPFAVTIDETTAARVGDIVDTLHLPGNQKFYLPQQVTIHRILDANTRKTREWREDSDVLFIGDSFSNIYSAPQMGWGDSAGFPYQLSRHLGRDIDALIKNGGAASELREKVAERPQPLNGKRLVIWEVAAHELTASNWKVVDISSSSAASPPAERP
jgi:alginate O-acetyltransferase complex protein AlgJ